MENYKVLTVRICKRGYAQNKTIGRLWKVYAHIRCALPKSHPKELYYFAQWFKNFCTTELGMTEEQFWSHISDIHGTVGMQKWMGKLENPDTCTQSGEIGYFTATILAFAKYIRFLQVTKIPKMEWGGFWANWKKMVEAKKIEEAEAKKKDLPLPTE